MRSQRLAAELIEAMGEDNGAIFLPCRRHYAQLDQAVEKCLNGGLKFTAVNIELIAYGEESEMLEAFGKTPGFLTLHLVLNEIFNGCKRCQTENKRRVL